MFSHSFIPSSPVYETGHAAGTDWGLTGVSEQTLSLHLTDGQPEAIMGAVLLPVSPAVGPGLRL